MGPPDQARPPSGVNTKRSAWRLVGGVVGVVIIGLALWALRGEWHAARDALLALRPSWILMSVSAAVVLAAYLVLIWTWRECLRDSGAWMPFADATRIWFVSNLARYIPGALWQIGALALLARRHGTSASAATSAAAVLTVLNTLCGLALVLAFGADVASEVSVPWVGVVGAVLALAALRWAAPPLLRRLAASTRWTLRMPAVGTRMLAASLGGSAVAWMTYGVAFKILLGAAFPALEITWSAAITVYIASYLAGFLSLGPPAGLGVAEGAMVYLLIANGIADPGVAAAVAAVTRIWRTALEVVPGLVFLPRQASRGNRMP